MPCVERFLNLLALMIWGKNELLLFNSHESPVGLTLYYC